MYWLNISRALLGATTQQRVRSAILSLAWRYLADIFPSMRWLNARFFTYTLFLGVKSLNQKYMCRDIFMQGRFKCNIFNGIVNMGIFGIFV